MCAKPVIMSGSGNIFAVYKSVDFMRMPGSASERVCDIARLYKGIEGVLVISDSSERDFDVEFFNPDGSDGMMCGNGGRCAVAFAQRYGFIDENKTENIRFSIAGTEYSASAKGRVIGLKFPPPTVEIKTIMLSGEAVSGTYINTGSDHFVIDFENIRNTDVLLKFVAGDISRFRSLPSSVALRDPAFDFDAFGRSIRNSEELMPRGANANLVCLTDDTVELRTYERGVEAETGACGTGAISTVTALKIYNRSATVIPPSGERLTVYVSTDETGDIQYCELTGEVKFL